MMADIENISNDDEFLAGTVDTPKEVAEQRMKWECLKSAISKETVLDGKKQRTHERVNKTGNETIN